MARNRGRSRAEAFVRWVRGSDDDELETLATKYRMAVADEHDHSQPAQFARRALPIVEAVQLERGCRAVFAEVVAETWPELDPQLVWETARDDLRLRKELGATVTDPRPILTMALEIAQRRAEQSEPEET